MLVIESSSLLVDLSKLSIKLTLDALEVLGCPSSESFLQPVLHPVNDDLSDGPLLLVAISRVFKPCVESSTHLALNQSAHVVCHDLLRQVLGLGLNSDTSRFAGLDLTFLVRNGQVLVLNLLLNCLTLLDLHHLKLSVVRILPASESHANIVSFHAVHSTLQEVSAEFELSHILFPSGHAVLERISTTA